MSSIILKLPISLVFFTHWCLAVQTRCGFSPCIALLVIAVTVMLLGAAWNLWSVKLEKSMDVSFLPLNPANFLCTHDDKYATSAS